MGFGVESASQKILDAMNKNITVSEAQNAIIKLKKHGIKPACSWIIGYWGETKETINETVDFCISNRFPSARFNILTPLPGSEVYRMAVDKGYIDNEVEYWGKIDAPFNEQLVLNLSNLSDVERLSLKAQGERLVSDTYKRLQAKNNNTAGVRDGI